MDVFTISMAIALFIVALTVYSGFKIVPQQEAWIVERLGKLHGKLEPGPNLIIPFFDRVAYRHSLKETAIDVPEQAGITRDNVTLTLDGILYVRVIDPVAASYGVNDPVSAVMMLAQTTMRSEIGKLTLDKTFEERETLNANIVSAINQAGQNWGIQCMRYEIRNISPPSSVLKAMELQMAAERQKRAVILESEGKRQSQINVAEGAKQETILKAEGQQRQVVLNAEARKQEVVLQSEAAQVDQVNRAKGEAVAIVAVAEATGEGIRKVAEAIREQGGADAVALRLGEQYIDAFKSLAKSTTTVLLPANAGDAGSMVAQALAVFDGIRGKSVVAPPAASNPTGGSGGPWGSA